MLLFTTCGVIGIVGFKRTTMPQLILFFTSSVMMFFFFWIIKNLLPKGDPKTTKKATKKNWQPKAAR